MKMVQDMIENCVASKEAANKSFFLWKGSSLHSDDDILKDAARRDFNGHNENVRTLRNFFLAKGLYVATTPEKELILIAQSFLLGCKGGK